MNNTFIDLFSGAGGFSLGFINAGWKCLAGVEFSSDAARTYYYNLCLENWSHLMIDKNDQKTIDVFKKAGRETNPNTPFNIPNDNWIKEEGSFPALSLWCMDINKLSPEEIMDNIGFKKKELSAIVGGPPCQGFSWANTQRNESDPRNQLVFRYLDYVEVMKPKIFLIENVRGILSSGKKKGDKEGPFPVWIRERANKIGYNLTYDVHNAAHYGVPQNRKRVIFYGTRKDLNLDPVLKLEPTHTHHFDPNEITMFEPEGKPFVSVFEAIGDLDMPLSSSRDVDAKKLPFGDRGRGPNEYSGEERIGDTYMMPDRFTGELFPVPITPWTDYQKQHYNKCLNCGKINLNIRKECWNCNTNNND